VSCMHYSKASLKLSCMYSFTLYFLGVVWGWEGRGAQVSAAIAQ
jgi:hypothetical protein